MRAIADLLAVGMAILASLIAAPGPLFIKRASAKVKMNVMSFFNLDLFFGACFYGVGTLITLIALSMGALSVIGPIFSLVYVWVTLISIKFLKERVTTRHVLGIVLVVIGIALVGSGV